jgi:gluconate 2-dehydrogenase gamma chain
MSTTMNRREVLQRVALLMGGALSAPAVLGVLNGCSAKQEASWKPVFLTEEQGTLVSEVADIMIPRTDTPGAKDVGVPAFIDTMLKATYPAEDQERFIAGLKEFESLSEREQGRAFLKLDPAQRATVVQKVHDAAVESEQLRKPGERVRRPFILMVKELSLLGYFTSEVGATQVLQYVAIPGAYHGCVPLSEAGNAKLFATDTSGRF